MKKIALSSTVYYFLFYSILILPLGMNFLSLTAESSKQDLKTPKKQTYITKGKKKLAYHWHSNVAVARKVMQQFQALTSYKADFKIRIKEGENPRVMSGRIYYQKPNKLRYEFDRPKGNLIVSDGRIMWFYVQKLKTVGKQELNLKVKDANGKNIFRSNPLTGVRRLFRKYHYRFDKHEQPRQERGRTFFALELEQREKIGGYERMKLYIDASTYLIYKAEGDDGYGKVSRIEFSNIQLNTPLEGKLFQYKPKNNISVVLNPLVSEEK